MTTREYDVVIFGATGYTGKFIASHWIKKYGKTTKFALAGRSKTKLEDLQKKLRQEIDGVKEIPIVVADALNDLQIQSMCKATSLLINCTGPFRLYGEPIVRGCVSAGTNYVDICGEPQFIETMMLRYNEEASRNNCIIVSACGFDSIPSEMGTVFTTKQFPKEGSCSSVEAFISGNGQKAHATTYECIVLGLAAADELKSLRSKERVLVPYIGPKLKLKNIGYDARERKYIVKFPGADASIVRNSQRYLTETKSSVTPTRFAIYATFESVWSILFLFIGGIFLMTLGRFESGRKLLINYPSYFTFGFFSHDGPSAKDLEDTKFQFRFYAKGYKASSDGPLDWEVITRIDGPEPGYIATSRMVCECAKTILDGQVKQHGVLTTASAFRNTKLIQQLEEQGIHFIVEKNGPFLCLS